jgi:hypothetical protein
VTSLGGNIFNRNRNQMSRYWMLYRTIGPILDSIHRLVCGRQKITTFRKLDLSSSCTTYTIVRILSSLYWMLFSSLCELNEMNTFSKYNFHPSVYLSHLSFMKMLNELIRSIMWGSTRNAVSRVLFWFTLVQYNPYFTWSPNKTRSIFAKASHYTKIVTWHKI